MLGVFSYFSKVFVSPIFEDSITNNITFYEFEKILKYHIRYTVYFVKMALMIIEMI